MILRSGRKKPYQMPPRRRQSVKKQCLRNRRTAARKPVFCEQPCFDSGFLRTSIRYSESTDSSVFSHRETVKCYILTEDSKTVHFDVDEDGHHEICTKDSQSCEDIAWLCVYTGNEGVTDSKNLVILTQRSKLNEFVLLCKGKKHLSLKVLKASCSEPDHPSLGRRNMKTCIHEDPNFKQLNDNNNFFIMHYQGDSVQFQCYEDRSYYLCVNNDSLDIRKLENRDPNKDKNFYFRVSYL
ncbi:PREDICTED: uncharacterized protein LOC101810272 isoform X2 [Ficedula albicollis]|uniref:uncharacterized protein LOC101810272 isoform X2 n=1 Tax=Ficedula albicollis TaxID=59894 RepID=UPI000359F694|nr:PREDICTED: uncharacterized protein LOC101810272 isoform X2 [Ficedula albicollis]